MRNALPLLMLTGLLVLFSTGCDSTQDESGTITLNGQVLDAQTKDPVPGAFVRIPHTEMMDGTDDILIETDSAGQYTARVTVDEITELELIANKDGFSSDKVQVTAVGGRTKEAPTLRLARTRAEELESGTPSNILLQSQSAEHIGVLESGSKEVARVTYQVTDSSGQAVTLDNEAKVRFSLGQQPGGGEFIAPKQAGTDNNGQVTVNLSSGTEAGVVQIVAEADVGDKTIRSKPVSVTIHGGLPDQDHFTLAPARFNFPGLLRHGMANPISVIVGDVHGNPVKPGTAVYFTTEHGVIEGSVLTDDQGRGTVSLISGKPVPPEGVTFITAETADSSTKRVSSKIPILFSGAIQMNVSPTTARLDQTYRLTVTDVNGNPLAKGTSINVRAEGNEVIATGNTNVTLGDTVFRDQNDDGDALDPGDVVRGPGITEFTFRAIKDPEPDNPEPSELGAISISISGPNGSLELALTSDGDVSTRTDEATIERLPNGRLQVRATE